MVLPAWRPSYRQSGFVAGTVPREVSGMNSRAKLGRVFEVLARPKRLKVVIFFVTSVCNAKCRTCFYREELNRRGDLTLEEIGKLSRTMPRFTDLWLSGGEPMLRPGLTDIVHLFCVG
ncbi:MAG: hypothetical protein DMG24_09035, partial [Acidobacteria bacterium]